MLIAKALTESEKNINTNKKMKRVYVVLKEDIVDYPPVLSIIQVLVDCSYKVIHLGTYSDMSRKKMLEDKGVEFVPMPKYNGFSWLIQKFVQQYNFKNKVIKFLNKENLSEDDRVWLIQSETIFLLYSLVKKYKTILHLLEFVEPTVSWKYRVISPFLDLAKTFQQSYRVVCCEYNRAQITKGIFQLDNLPIVLPNKMITDNSENDIVPDDVSTIVADISNKCKGKKIILYQGIFLDKERRLEEFCDAMSTLSDDYVFIAMGRGSDMYESLKKRYESNRILFIPFIRPPYHLLITQMASIGVMSYFPRKGTIGKTLNPIYCAPNKIYEYSKYGIPMISNDIPALKYAFMEYQCGECIEYPMGTNQIIKTINVIMDNYSKYQEGSLNLYESVNIKEIIQKIL